MRGADKIVGDGGETAMATKKNRRGGLGRVLMLAASVTVLSAAIARAQNTPDMIDLNNRILDNPQDADLNLQYARAAESHGELRLALAAYERILINDPNNSEAQRGYERVRRAIEPAYTFARVELGERWDSNPLNLSSGGEGAYSTFARATIVDERPIASTRWRSIANFEGEVTPEIEQLNYAFLGVQTGPLIDLAPHLAAIPSIGGGIATLDGGYYFDDINLGVTLEGQQQGVSYWTRLRGGWRHYGKEWTADQGGYGELIGGVTAPRVLSERGSLVVVPWLRWSGIQGTAFNFQLNEPITPGEYAELGLDATYNYRLNDHVVVSTGVEARDRYYSKTKIAGEDRHDTYLSPQATLSLQHLLPCNCSINLTYRYRNNSSNDFTADYDANQVSLSLFAQF